MALSTQTYKGARDFYPEDKRLQKWMFATMRSVVERYGYEEYDAPIFEPVEVYLAKTGDEIVNEQTYAFTDRGDRRIAIRPEMTPTVSRLVAAKRQELSYPLRWYNIGGRWRYERPQRGRYREFFQLDVDLFGIEGLEADLEIISVADAVMKAYGSTHEMYTIRVNSRKLTDFLLSSYLGLNEIQVTSLQRLIDRMHKMDHAAFAAELDALFAPSQREQGLSDKLLDILKIQKISGLPQAVREHESAKELQRLLEMLEQSMVINAKFDITLMRGFEYYTDIVFEVFDNHPENNRAMFGGGRYDGLVGLFGVEPVASVGFAMGDVTLLNFLTAHNLLPKLKPEAELYVVLIGDVYQKAQKVLTELREMELNVAVSPNDSKPDKQIKAALKKGINYVLFIGEQELKDEQYNLKNLQSGEEEKHSAQRIVSLIKDYRRRESH